MNEYSDQGDSMLDEPPKHDMLTVKFRGDIAAIVLPLCEVTNGYVATIDKVDRHIDITTISDDKPEKVKLTFENFVKIVEDTFDIKEVVQVSLQKAETYENIQVL
jgi:hypothetical protein